MQLADVRRMAMALLGTTESPHHRYTSFRVRGRIYATAPRRAARCTCLSMSRTATGWCCCILPFTKSSAGRKVVGLRVNLGRAHPDDVAGLLRAAWQRKLPTRS